MRQVTQAFPHLDGLAVKDKVKSATQHWERQKWLVVYNAIVDPSSASEIAKHIGVSKGFVRQVIPSYNRLGETAIETPGKGGRRNCYLRTGTGKTTHRKF
jgi:hypothetical protein